MKKVLICLIVLSLSLLGSYYLYNSGKPNYLDLEIVDLTEKVVDDEIINELLEYNNLKNLNLGQNDITTSYLLKLLNKFPTLKIDNGNIEFFDDVKVNINDEEIILNDHEIQNPDELIKIFNLFPNLKRIEMCDTGISNEKMAEIRDLLPNIKVVWKVYLNKWSIKTDTLAFSTMKTTGDNFFLTSEEAQVLKYCTDMVALDIGHNAVLDVSFLEYMPNLKILILVDQGIHSRHEYLSDLSVLKNCPKLEYLEFFVGNVSDLSFLEYTPNIKDLNISYNPIGNSEYKYLKNLTKIERLFMEKTGISHQNYLNLKSLYPNAQIELYGEGSVDHGWRLHKRFYIVRDMFENNYVHEIYQ